MVSERGEQGATLTNTVIAQRLERMKHRPDMTDKERRWLEQAIARIARLSQQNQEFTLRIGALNRNIVSLQRQIDGLPTRPLASRRKPASPEVEALRRQGWDDQW